MERLKVQVQELNEEIRRLRTKTPSVKAPSVRFSLCQRATWSLTGGSTDSGDILVQATAGVVKVNLRQEALREDHAQHVVDFTLPGGTKARLSMACCPATCTQDMPITSSGSLRGKPPQLLDTATRLPSVLLDGVAGESSSSTREGQRTIWERGQAGCRPIGSQRGARAYSP